MSSTFSSVIVEGMPVRVAVVSCDYSVVSSGWLKKARMRLGQRCNLLVSCTGLQGTGSFLLSCLVVNLEDYDALLGSDAVAYYQELCCMSSHAEDVCAQPVLESQSLPLEVCGGGDMDVIDDVDDNLALLARLDDQRLSSMVIKGGDYPSSGRDNILSPSVSGEGNDPELGSFSAGEGTEHVVCFDEDTGLDYSTCSGTGQPFAISVIHGMLFGRAVSGARALVFSSDMEHLRALLRTCRRV
ncbi:hypothetical protein EDD18DRAFT_1163197 [Armillaria luteobubalina]|uniref:Uncharacterized protein n=1 Tax=Armillaria luteobubalina TaxID=153913 RepID=A0AA39TPC9_9AGAR|nr:hypothetical protein EDD18DRAFT_1163197 [Armillaria luteobubalina]